LPTGVTRVRDQAFTELGAIVEDARLSMASRPVLLHIRYERHRLARRGTQVN
jgi:hypothetical protein